MRGVKLLALLLPVVFLGQVAAQVPPTPNSLALSTGPALACPPPGESDSGPPDHRFFVTAEFLYLQPYRDGLGVAALSTTSGGMTSSSLETLSWDGTPGFRIGGHYRVTPDVELGPTLTYFHASTQQTISAPEGGSLLGTLATADGARNASAADASAGLSYAVLDLDAGKTMRVGESLGVRAFGGLRLASIDQTLKATYSGGSLGTSPDFVTSPLSFRGAGLTAGAEATWNIYRGWGLYGRGRLALMAGMFDSKRDETLGGTLIDEESDRFYTVIPVAELGAGVQYQGERWFFSVGYEATDWLNMVSGIGGPGVDSNLVPRRRGDLTLEALTVRVGFSF